MNPLRFTPIYQQRIWGGREIQRLFARELPADGQPYGESWELVDREEAQSIVQGGDYDGLSLHELWMEHRTTVFGAKAPDSPRFPLLVKILDAREDLSLQVHPPAWLAADLGGEPKTEMWYVAEASEGATLAVGVRRGVDREVFAEALAGGYAGDLVPRLAVQTGDAIFIPSGRLHAIGAGLVIFEIQQNSDTTYRVFDWNRLGLDGKPRTLHVEESLRCIDFSDNAPSLLPSREGTLVKCEFFKTTQHHLAGDETHPIGTEGSFALLIIVSGQGAMAHEIARAGDHLLLPATMTDGERSFRADTPSVVLVVTFG